MDHFLRDFLYGFRILFKKPGLTLLAVLALVVSIGMMTSSFSVLNGLLLKKLPFEDSDRLYTVVRNYGEDPKERIALPADELSYLRARQDVFESLAGFYSGTVNLSGDATPTRYDGAFFSPDFLEIIRVEPILGSGFTMVEGRSVDDEVLISYEVWEERYRKSPDVIGKPVRANGAVREIVGVMPKGFKFPTNVDIWIPLSWDNLPNISGKRMDLISIGRLKDDVSPDTAQAQMRELAAARPEPMQEPQSKASQLVVERFGKVGFEQGFNYMTTLSLTAVTFVLLISCANVANLLIGRAATRGKEMAIRASLGATRRRIITQLLIESCIVAVIGGIGGLIYAAWAVDMGWNLVKGEVPYWMNFDFDWRVFAFAFLLVIGTAFLSGIVPAWQASKTDLNEMLKETNRTATSFRLGRFTRLLAVVQIAFSCALLFGAGVSIRSAWELSSVDPGYPADEILTMRMGLFEGDYPTPESKLAFFDTLSARIENLPGVDGAAVTSWLAYHGNYQAPFIIDPESAADPNTKLPFAYFENVSAGYFDTMGVSVLRGRGFMDGVDELGSEQVAVINQSFASRHFPGTDPVGKQVHCFIGNALMTPAPGAIPVTIVGVVEDVITTGFRRPRSDNSAVYLPASQNPASFMTLLVDVPNGDPHDFIPVINKEILGLDPHLPTYFVKTMDEFIEEQIKPFKVMAESFVMMGAMALFLAAVGIYGMMAFSVNQRRHEIGIRMALGAKGSEILRMILRQGLVQLVLGVAVGLGLAVLIGALLRNIVFNAAPGDPGVFVAVLAILSIVALWACFVPARRATRLSPMEALRYE